MNVAYFTNVYPKQSHTFIRREIAAVEAEGISVERISIRPAPDSLIDPEDRDEAQRTHVLFDAGYAAMVRTAAEVAAERPSAFARAFRASLKLAQRSDRGFGRDVSYLITACSLLRHVERTGCDHIHAHFGTNPAAIAMLCRLLGGPPYSFTVHGPEEFDRVSSDSLPDKIAYSEMVAVISGFGRSQLLRLTDYEQWSKVKVVRCGVDIELVLVGDGEMRGEIEALIRRCGLGDVVSITGWATGSEVSRHILDARAFVLPSFAEGLPVVIMEALALQRPVISTHIAGIPELVEEGRSGWLVPAGSVPELADAIVDALATPVERLSAMGAEGRRRVADDHYTPTAVTPLIESFAAPVRSVAI